MKELARVTRERIADWRAEQLEPEIGFVDGRIFRLRLLQSGIVAGFLALTSVAAAAWKLPAPSTPGAVASSDPTVVCAKGYSRTVRPPYDYAWRRFRVSVFRAYGIPHEQWNDMTIDHLVPLALGGAPEDPRNVWPEPKAEAKRKDEVEDALVVAACYRHTLTLEAAQASIAHDWTSTPVGLPAIHDHHYAGSGE